MKPCLHFASWCFQPISTPLPGILLRADDRDIPLGDWYDFIIYNSPDAYLLLPDNASGLVLVNGDIRVAKNAANRTIDVTVKVYDSYAARGDVDVETNLTVVVIDINDHEPVFEPTSYNGSVLGRINIVDLVYNTML